MSTHPSKKPISSTRQPSFSKTQAGISLYKPEMQQTPERRTYMNTSQSPSKAASSRPMTATKSSSAISRVVSKPGTSTSPMRPVASTRSSGMFVKKTGPVREPTSNVMTASTNDVSYYSEKIRKLKEENSKLRKLLTEAEDTFKAKVE